MVNSDIIYELFKSKEMAEYLSQNINNLSALDILNMICMAPIDIRRKAEILKLCAENEDVKSEINTILETEQFSNEIEKEKTIKKIYQKSFGYNYRICLNAVNELTKDDNAIFTVQNVWVDEDMLIGYHYSDIEVCSTFDGVLDIIKEQMEFEEWNWNNKEQLFWYVITKWIPADNGRYQQVMEFYMIDGKVSYFILRGNNHSNKFSPSCHLNLITPFKTGDMLCVDCTPFAEEQNVLVLENSNNNDCCSLQAIYVCEDGTLKTGAIKHASVLSKWLWPEISPLYKIRTTESLKSNEKILLKLRAYIKSDFQKGKLIWELSHKGITIKNMEKFLKENSNG